MVVIWIVVERYFCAAIWIPQAFASYIQFAELDLIIIIVLHIFIIWTQFVQKW